MLKESSREHSMTMESVLLKWVFKICIINEHFCNWNMWVTANGQEYVLLGRHIYNIKDSLHGNA